MRKLATLLVALGLTLGLIGAGVSASFSDQVTATQNIDVGTLACKISATTAGDISLDEKSVTYNAPTIVSSAAGSAPFTFTVMTTGDVPARFHLTKTTPDAPFTSILGNPGDVTLTQGGTHAYAAGLQWPELGPSNMGQTVSITYTVDCLEGSLVTLPNGPMASTNAANITNGWANTSAALVGSDVVLTLNQPRAHYACFEYRTDGDTNQKLSDTHTYNPAINDGLYPYVCVNAGSSTTVNVGPVASAEVRMVFGAESDERFDWTTVYP